jgi:hypothetical protein
LTGRRAIAETRQHHLLDAIAHVVALFEQIRCRACPSQISFVNAISPIVSFESVASARTSKNVINLGPVIRKYQVV